MAGFSFVFGTPGFGKFGQRFPTVKFPVAGQPGGSCDPGRQDSQLGHFFPEVAFSFFYEHVFRSITNMLIVYL